MVHIPEAFGLSLATTSGPGSAGRLTSQTHLTGLRIMIGLLEDQIRHLDCPLRCNGSTTQPQTTLHPRRFSQNSPRIVVLSDQ